jgi:hypothetical protein
MPPDSRQLFVCIFGLPGLVFVGRVTATDARGRILEAETPPEDAARGPIDAGYQLGRIHAHRTGELNHRRDASDSLAVLEQTDLGSVQGRACCQLVLRQPFAATDATQVVAESLSHLVRSRLAVVFSHSAAKWRFSDKCRTDKTFHLRYSACRTKPTGGIDPIWENFTMALTIKDKETEALVAKIASLTGESEAEAVRIAMRERVERLELEAPRPRRADDPRRSPEAFREWLETEIWSLLPPEALGGPPMTKAERAEILGYGHDEE